MGDVAIRVLKRKKGGSFGDYMTQVSANRQHLLPPMDLPTLNHLREIIGRSYRRCYLR
jgi:hypothetical protein